MSAENTKTEGQPVEPSGKSIMKFLQNNRDGATVADVVRHLRAELRCADTDQLHKSVEKLMDNGVSIGFLSKDGIQYRAWNPAENKSTKRGPPSKKQKRDDDADRRSIRSDDDADSGRRSHRSDNEGSTRKRRSDKNDERRSAKKKDAGQAHRSDEERDPPRRQRRRRARPAEPPAGCYCYSWTPRRRAHRSASSRSSISSSIVD